jgi:hypothetical protein
MRAPEAERPVWCHTAPPRPQRHPRRPRHSRRPRHQQLRHHPRWLPFQARPHERPHHHRSTLEAYRRIRPGDCHPSCCPPAPLRRPPSQSRHLPDYQIGQRHHRQNCCRHSEATTHRRMRSPAKRSQRRTGNSGPTIFPTHQSARHQATPLAPRVHARPRNDGDSASEPGRRRRADFRDASSCSPPAKVLHQAAPTTAVLNSSARCARAEARAGSQRRKGRGSDCDQHQAVKRGISRMQAGGVC